jgi:hypothetical protein
MKLVKNFVFVVILLSTLAFNTVAGEVQIPGYVPPPPPPMTVETDDSLTPVSSTDILQTGAEPSDYVLYEVLAALLSIY